MATPKPKAKPKRKALEIDPGAPSFQEIMMVGHAALRQTVWMTPLMWSDGDIPTAEALLDAHIAARQQEAIDTASRRRSVFAIEAAAASPAVRRKSVAIRRPVEALYWETSPPVQPHIAAQECCTKFKFDLEEGSSDALTCLADSETRAFAAVLKTVKRITYIAVVYRTEETMAPAPRAVAPPSLAVEEAIGNVTGQPSSSPQSPKSLEAFTPRAKQRWNMLRANLHTAVGSPPSGETSPSGAPLSSRARELRKFFEAVLQQQQEGRPKPLSPTNTGNDRSSPRPPSPTAPGLEPLRKVGFGGTVSVEPPSPAPSSPQARSPKAGSPISGSPRNRQSPQANSKPELQRIVFDDGMVMMQKVQQQEEVLDSARRAELEIALQRRLSATSVENAPPGPRRPRRAEGLGLLVSSELIRPSPHTVPVDMERQPQQPTAAARKPTPVTPPRLVLPLNQKRIGVSQEGGPSAIAFPDYSNFGPAARLSRGTPVRGTSPPHAPPTSSPYPTFTDPLPHHAAAPSRTSPVPNGAVLRRPAVSRSKSAAAALLEPVYADRPLRRPTHAVANGPVAHDPRHTPRSPVVTPPHPHRSSPPLSRPTSQSTELTPRLTRYVSDPHGGTGPHRSPDSGNTLFGPAGRVPTHRHHDGRRSPNSNPRGEYVDREIVADRRGSIHWADTFHDEEHVSARRQSSHWATQRVKSLAD